MRSPCHHPVCQWLWIGSGPGLESEPSQTQAPLLLGPPAQPSWVFLRKPGPWAPSLSPRTGHLPSCLKGGQGKDRYPGTCHRDRQAQRPQALGPHFGPRLALPLPAARPPPHPQYRTTALSSRASPSVQSPPCRHVLCHFHTSRPVSDCVLDTLLL
mgnify:CR=1 FL=1